MKVEYIDHMGSDLSVVNAARVSFDKTSDWYPTFEDELCKFPRGRHDDQVDAFAYLGMLLNTLVAAETRDEIEEEEYELELEQSGINLHGRNSVTGY